VLMSIILLLNLLIAMLSTTFHAVYQSSTLEWRYLFAKYVLRLELFADALGFWETLQVGTRREIVDVVTHEKCVKYVYEFTEVDANAEGHGASHSLFSEREEVVDEADRGVSSSAATPSRMSLPFSLQLVQPPKRRQSMSVNASGGNTALAGAVVATREDIGKVVRQLDALKDLVVECASEARAATSGVAEMRTAIDEMKASRAKAILEGRSSYAELLQRMQRDGTGSPVSPPRHELSHALASTAVATTLATTRSTAGSTTSAAAPMAIAISDATDALEAVGALGTPASTSAMDATRGLRLGAAEDAAEI